MRFQKVLLSFFSVTLLLFLLLGIWHRFTDLSGTFWSDEIFTSWISQAPWSGFWDYLRYDNNPPLYYLFVRMWGSAFSFSEASLRFPAALAGIITILASWYAGRKLFSRFVGYTAAALVSASSILVFYSREARAYSFLALFSVLSLIAFWRWLERPTRWRFVLYCLATILNLANHYAALGTLLAQAVFFILDRKRHQIPWRKGLLAIAVFFVAFLPWLLFNIIPRLHEPLGLPIYYFAVNTDPWSVFKVLVAYTMYVQVQESVVNWFRPIVIAGFWILVLAAGKRLKDTFRHNKDSSNRRALIYLFLLLSVPMVGGVLTRIDFPKYFIGGSIAFYLICAFAIEQHRLRHSSLIVAWAIIYLLFTAQYLPLMKKIQDYQWRDIGAYLERHERPGDIILVQSWVNELSLQHYYRGRSTVKGIFPIRVPDNLSYYAQVTKYATAQLISERTVDWLDDATAGSQRVWFINHDGQPFFNGRLVRDWFVKNGWVVTSEIGQGYLTSFERRLP